MRHALVTGGAGFIGSHLVDKLLSGGWQVTTVDNFDPFYSKDIKERNIANHRHCPGFRLVEADIRCYDSLLRHLTERFDIVVHLAAKGGVRPSIQDPTTYQEVNVGGTQNLLEFAKRRGIEHFVFASSSSVYGVNPNVPWHEDDHVLQPISPYASTKVSAELLGHVYSHLHGIRFIALRFFTVHGPRQRPDLAIHKFARLMLSGKPIPYFGDGTTCRDYTYIDDIVSGIRAAMDYDRSMYEVINLGNNQTVSLAEMVRGLESVLGVKAELDHRPPQPGDVPRTLASIDKAIGLLKYEPSTPFLVGMSRFAEWLGKA
ncbi:MAG: NAD-dependent epimerase/dehydratase family protein [Bryobacteraceae bacterium]